MDERSRNRKVGGRTVAAGTIICVVSVIMMIGSYLDVGHPIAHSLKGALGSALLLLGLCLVGAGFADACIAKRRQRRESMREEVR